MKNSFLLLTISFIFSSCIGSIPTPEKRKENALALVENKGFSEVDIKTSTFSLFSLQNNQIDCKNKNLKVYIEGDGLAWITRNTISENPSPINATAIKLMNQDSDKCKVYLARPCQFITSNKCDKKYWTSHRFSSEVLKSYEESLDYLKSKYENKSFTLIGYSGGGAIATLLASKKDDIKMLITIAGNLDTDKWTSYHKITKLDGSLNPSSYSNKLKNIKQYHLIGEKDGIIPQEIFLSYLSKFDKKDKISHRFFNTDHNCCWEKSYKIFLDDLK